MNLINEMEEEIKKQEKVINSLKNDLERHRNSKIGKLYHKKEKCQKLEKRYYK